MTVLSQILTMLGSAVEIPGWLVLAAAVAVAFGLFILLARAEHRDNPLTVLALGGLLVACVGVGGAIVAGQSRAAVAAGADALATRAAALEAAASQSPVGCIAVDEALMVACESALFDKPEQVAAAKSLLRARLALVEDGYAFVQRYGQTQFAERIALWRQPLERDPFGLVGAMLADIPGCTQTYCREAAFVGSTDQIGKNLQEGRYQALILKYAPVWERAAKVRSLAAQPARTGPFGFRLVDRPGEAASGDGAPVANLPVDDAAPVSPPRPRPHSAPEGAAASSAPAAAPAPARPAARSSQNGATGTTRAAAQPRPRPPAAASSPAASPSADGDGDADAQ